jgi:hypothetical protein
MSAPAFWLLRFVPTNHSLGYGMAAGGAAAAHDVKRLISAIQRTNAEERLSLPVPAMA